MNKLFEDRATFAINLIALTVAIVLAAERAFVEQQIFGSVTPALWQLLFPVVVMFVIRNRIFSSGFLFLYVALTVLIGREVWQIRNGSPYHYDGYMGLRESLFFVLSIICLSLYAVAILVGAVLRFWKR